MDHCGLGALRAAVLCVALGGSVLGCSSGPGEPISSPSASPSISTQITPSATASPSVQPTPVASKTPGSPSGSSASPIGTTGSTPSPSTQPQPQTSATASASPSALPIAKQDTGKTYLSTILVSQQAEKLVSGRFSDDLPRLAPEVPLQNEEYQIEVRQADASQAVVVAIAKRPGFASYTGVVYAVKDQLPVTQICKTNIPSQTPPQPPQMVNRVMLCAAGSSSAN